MENMTIGSEFINKADSFEAFGVKDAKGREIGAKIRTFEEVFSFGPGVAQYPGSDYAHTCNIAPGLYYGFYPHATRNGKPYGAGQPVQRFATTAERDAAIAKYLAGARKRAEKAARAKLGDARPPKGFI